MSEANKIIENLKNSGRKVEEFYTGNKTSDKNVANIEDDVNMIHKIISFYKDLDTLHNNDKCKEIQALEHLLAEREQKDKRIQELEELVEGMRHNTNKIIEVTNLYLNSIPKQAVIDELKRLNIMFKKTMKGRIQEYTVEEIIIRSNTLQELLKGGK